MELRGYLSILRARWVVLAFVTLLSLLVALAYLLAAPAVYTASSRVFLSVSVGQTPAELSRSYSYAQGLVRSYAQVATEAVVLEPVIKKLKLGTSVSDLADSITAQAPLDTVIIDISVRYRSAERAAQIADAIADQLSTAKLVPGTTDKNLPVTLVKLAPADVPVAPTSPRRGLSLAMGGAVGLLLGAVGAVGRDTLDPRVRTAREAAAVTTAPVLGAVVLDPPARRFRGRLHWPHRLRRRRVAPDWTRELRSNFQVVQRRRALRSVAFTSAEEDTATGRAVAGLATALADTGAEVLIVDADSRRPTLGAEHGLSGTGLASLLTGESPTDDAVLPSGVPGVWVLPAGPVLDDPATLVDAAAFTAALARLTERFDVVLVKAPPVLQVAEALVACRASDGVVVVSDGPAMDRDLLKDELRALQLVGAEVVGLVLARSA
jgi:succinoglycan biosynthesis transport protein ExoP